MSSTDEIARNVLRQPLQVCSMDPKTGFLRDGFCSTGQGDQGRHLLCARVTADFLSFSASRGNDLTTPVAAFGFPGLQPGDCWCLCVDRWLEALEAGVAPPVVLEATHESVLRNVDLEILQRYAAESDT